MKVTMEKIIIGDAVMDINLYKRGISFLLCLAMLIGNVPATVFAAESDGLCAHHT